MARCFGVAVNEDSLTVAGAHHRVWVPDEPVKQHREEPSLLADRNERMTRAFGASMRVSKTSRTLRGFWPPWVADPII
jgi:hypothetical protein